MRDCPFTIPDDARPVTRNETHVGRRRTSSSLSLRRSAGRSWLAGLALASWLGVLGGGAARGQEAGTLPEFAPGFADDVAPTSEYGGGEFFSQDLGTLLRIRYNTESYGQEDHGNLDIGTMKVFNHTDAVTFLDGQVTLNDTGGVGFNTGMGLRWLGWTPFPLEPERINGVSVWADGTHTSSGGFFPQVGVSYESLGDLWDFRANSYIPVGQSEHTGNERVTQDITYSGNNIGNVTLSDRFRSFNVGELEFARRLGADRDAWAFAGPYALANDVEDSAGYRFGVRGYAYPDLMLQVAVSDDEIFQTNTTFQVIWFVGRTRTDYQPAYGLADRMREPVLRNDYVALSKETVAGSTTFTDPEGEAIRFVHVDSDAPAGGDGTFENPLNDVGTVNTNSEDGDIVLLYSDSVFDMQDTLALQDNQRLLGEGNDMTFQIDTEQAGTIDIPETSPGAREGPAPIIMDSIGTDAITLADANEVANLSIDGGTNGIVAGTDGAGNPNLHDLSIENLAGDGIVTTPYIRVDEDDPALMTIAGNVTIDEVEFDNVAGTEIDVDADTGAIDPDDPNVTLEEQISITNVVSTNGGGHGVHVRNTHAGGLVTLEDYTNGTASDAGGGSATDSVVRLADIDGDVMLSDVSIQDNVNFAFDFENVDADSEVMLSDFFYDGRANDAGGVRLSNFDGMFTASDGTLMQGEMLAGVSLGGGSAGDILFAEDVSFTEIDGTTFDVDGFTGTLTVNGNITNSSGMAVAIQNVSDGGLVVFEGDIEHGAQATPAGDVGILVENNQDGSILFNGEMELFTTGANGVTIAGNSADTDIDFAGELDIDTASANAFDATGGGVLTVSDNDNSVTTTGGTALRIEDMEVSVDGVAFASLDTTGATHGIELRNNEGGAIAVGIVGNEAGENGTITGVVDDAVVIDNSANVAISGLDIDAADGFAGVSVTKTTAETQTLDLSSLAIHQGARGIDISGNGTGTLNMTVEDTTIEDSTEVGVRIDDIDAGNIQVNGTTIDGDPTDAGAQGVLISDSDASISFDGDTSIEGFDGTDFEVDGGAGTISMAGDIDNTDGAGRSIHVHDISGGSVTMTGSVDDQSEGILVEDNTGGDVNLIGDYTLDTGANTAVTIDNNTGADVSLGDLEITTTSGDGFVATGGGSLTVIGADNTVDTVDGVGVRIEDMEIGSAGVSFETVNVTDGDTNAIVLENLTGPGTVSIGNAGGAANSGGTLTTDGDAIVVRDVMNVELQQIQIVNSGGDGVLIEHTSAASGAMDVTMEGMNIDMAAGEGIDIDADNDDHEFRLSLLEGDLDENVTMDVTGEGTAYLLVEGTEIDVDGADDAFALQFSGSAGDGQITFGEDNEFTADAGQALFFDSTGSNAKTIDMLIEDSEFLSMSNGDAAVDIRSRINTTLNATVEGNVFDAPVGTYDFDMRTDAGTGRIRLKLGGEDPGEMNTAANNGFVVREDDGDFDIYEVEETITNDNFNNGAVDAQPNDAAFDDLPDPPPLPELP